MSLYELTFILRQDIATSEIKNITEKLGNIIKQGGGKLLKEENWGLRYLAYPIKKNKKGHYVMLVFSASAEKVLDELKRIISLSEDIIRNLLMKVASFSGKDSIMIQKDQAEGNEIKKI